MRLPERLALRLAGLRWRWRLAPTPPSLLPFTVHPWVVANDRLKADGWEPARSNEEAYVGAHRAGPWATLSPRRRQELALGAAGAALVGGAALAATALVAPAPPAPPAIQRRPSQQPLRHVLDGHLDLVVTAVAPVADDHHVAGLVGAQGHHQVGLDRTGSPPTSVITSPLGQPAASAGLPAITRRTSAPPSNPIDVGLVVAEVGALDAEPAVGDLAVGEELVGEAADELDRRGEPEARFGRPPGRW